MSNISSDTLAREDNRSVRHTPWKAICVFILLLAAAAVWLLCVPPALRDHRDARHVSDLLTVGATVESIESQLPEAAADAQRILEKALTPLFNDDDLAAVRIWQGSTLLGEITRDRPQTLHRQTALQDIARPATIAAEQLPAERRELMLVLLQLIADQYALIAQMDAALQAGNGAGVHTGLYVQAFDNLHLLEPQRKKHDRLVEAGALMDDAVQALTHADEASLRAAMDSIKEAEVYLSWALEELRAVSDTVSLPASLIAAAPPGNWLQQIIPLMRGRRLTIPLYVASGDASLIMDAGCAEFIFYDRTADQARAIGWPLLLVGGLLLGALLVPMLWRTKRA